MQQYAGHLELECDFRYIAYVSTFFVSLITCLEAVQPDESKL